MAKLFGMMMYSENLDETLKMYEEMFGFKAEEQWEGFHSFNFENGKFFVVFAPMTGAPFMVTESDNIENEVKRLKGAGFDVQDIMEVKTGKFAFYQDKKGNDFGLFQQG